MSKNIREDNICVKSSTNVDIICSQYTPKDTKKSFKFYTKKIFFYTNIRKMS